MVGGKVDAALHTASTHLAGSRSPSGGSDRRKGVAHDRDTSPIIVSDGAAIPPDAANSYAPTASPEGRTPHARLGKSQSLFDSFGLEWTLLRLGEASGDRLIAAAEAAGMPLEVVYVRSNAVRELYEAPLVLIRPDQMVAWRGHDDLDASVVVARLSETHLRRVVRGRVLRKALLAWLSSGKSNYGPIAVLRFDLTDQHAICSVELTSGASALIRSRHGQTRPAREGLTTTRTF